MSIEHWQKQKVDSPLFPDILWEKPMRRDLAGRLLIIGGSEQGLHDSALAYQEATEAGIGETRVVIPESIKALASGLPGIDLLPATSSGNLGIKGREHLIFAAHWADGVLLAGNFGRNSETALLLSSLVHQYRGPLTATKDSLELLNGEMTQLIAREETLLVMSLSQLQRAAKEIGFSKAFTSKMDLLHFVEALSELSSKARVAIITKHHDSLIAAYEGRVVSTERPDLDELWCVEIASRATVFWLHNRSKFFDAIATGLI